MAASGFLDDSAVAIAGQSLKTKALREIALFLGLLLLGLLALPIAVYMVGNAVFGEYGGAGFMGFYNEIHAAVRSGDGVVWFLVLSPYLICQVVRFSVRYFVAMSARPTHPQRRVPPAL